MKTYVLDANVLVRFLTQDSPILGSAAKKLFEAADRGEAELRLHPAIVAEVVFVLTKVYQQDRTAVADALLDIIENPGIAVECASVLRDALKRFKSVSVDFPDALIAALAADGKVPVASFDRDLDKFKDITRFEPPT
jgi:predicted nucleic acid-binding protein